METVILIPGTYDLPTKGHEAMWCELAKVGRLIVAIGRNTTKSSCVLQPTTRGKLIEQILASNKIEGQVLLYDGSLVDAVRESGATLVVRGVRGATDLEEGFAFTDHFARCGSVPIVFMPSPAELRGFSSSLVRQLLPLPSMDEEIQRLLPDPVYRCVRRGALGTRVRFEALWNKLAAQGSPTPVFEDLLLRYGEERRAYHVFEHVQAILLRLDEIQAAHPLRRKRQIAWSAIEWSLWFHDAVQTWREGNNEIAAAELAVSVALQAGLSKKFQGTIKRLILGVRRNSLPVGLEAELMTDVHLSILGASEQVFDRYEALIRKEWEFVPERNFRAERARILHQFLDRPSIFFTDYAKTAWEAQAQMNLARSLVRLETNSPLPSL